MALWVPIAFRRQTPELVFGVTAGIAFVQWLISVAGVLEFGVLLAVLRWGSGPSTLRLFLLLTGMVLAALLLGVTQRSRRAHLTQLVDRAERLERERDQ